MMASTSSEIAIVEPAPDGQPKAAPTSTYPPINNSIFQLTTADLVNLFQDNKTKSEGEEKLTRLGGVHGLLKALSVDPEYGISTLGTEELGSVAVSKYADDKKVGSSGDVLNAGSGGAGISEELRRETFGANVLPAAKTKSLLQFILTAMSDKILILLSVAAIASLGVGLYEDLKFVPDDAPPEDKQKSHWIEGFAILVAVTVVVLVSSINDFQKEAQFRKLNAKKEDRKVKAIRDGKTQLVSIYAVVVGDVLLLEPGDVIPADGVFISGMGLKCDESAATGETDAIKKGDGHDPFILSGSKVNEGIGKYLVTCVGPNSFHGRTMMALRTEMEDTPLQIKLDAVAERIAKLGLSVAVLMFVALLIKYIVTVLRTNGFGNSVPAQESGSEVATTLLMIIISCITVIVVAVPEGLPLAVTLALAFATTRMLKDNNLVRVLSACETMGNATTICSDKTGTLTQNKMTVVTGVVGKNVMFEGDEEVRELRKRVDTLAKSPSADPTEALVDSNVKHDGPDGGRLMDVVMEGVAINSTAFEGKDEESGEVTLIGSKTETALLQWLVKCGYDFKTLRGSQTVTVEQVYPFSSEKKSMATLVKVLVPGKKPIYRIHVKGASEIVLRSCNRFALLPFSPSPTAVQTAIKTGTNNPPLDRVPVAGSRSNPTHPIVTTVDPKDGKPRKDYEELIERFASQSLRTICLAYREFTEEEFLGLVRGTVREKVLAAKKAEEEEARLRHGAGVDEPEVLKGELPPPSPSIGNSTMGLPSTPTDQPQSQNSRSISGMLLEIPNSGVNAETRSFVSDSDDGSGAGGRNSEVGAELSDKEILADPVALAELSRHLICAAVVGIEDPLRAGVPEAVKQCQDAGVFVRMVTGDNVSTARSIATKCGILSRGGLVMEGSYFRNMSPEEMAEKLPRLQVLARSSPTDKQLLVSNLKALGETVAVTGDGTNDGPALKMADIGFSMGIAGTEVAKEASSIILMDDSFASVVKAISWGRCVNDAVKKFLQFQLSVNVSAVMEYLPDILFLLNNSVVITVVSALADSGESSVLTAVQLLWVNLIMDSLGALALATEKPTPDLLKRPPESKKTPLITFAMWKMIVGQAILQIVLNLALLFAGPQLFEFDELVAVGGVLNVKKGTASDIVKSQKNMLRTVVFNSFVFLQIFNLINCRRLDSRINVFERIFGNPYFVAIFGAVAVGQVIIVEFGGNAFQTVPLNGKLWAICVLIGLVSLPWAMVIRLFPDDLIRDWFKQRNHTAHDDIEASLPSSRNSMAENREMPLQAVSNRGSVAQFINAPPTRAGPSGGDQRRQVPLPIVTTKLATPQDSPDGPHLPTSTSTGAASVDGGRRESITAREQWGQAIRTVQTEVSVFKTLRGEARRRQRNDTISSIGSVGSNHTTSSFEGASVHPSAVAVANIAARGHAARPSSRLG
ncbi:hypothetical protein HDU76_000085 [Blyttiomyces sp. JEL0837]|nr:hypothetical protein HDU76_000085 [Blyttiomyces sp. JEL0837]